MKFFENKKTRGAVSIFLVMILLPTMLLSAVLIDGSRMASARAMAQEAADLAASSTIADYNQELKDQFGLFALKESDKSKLESVYKESLAATLLASGLSDDKEYSEKLWGIMKKAVGITNPYEGKSFLNLYDFSVDSCSVEQKFSLAEKDVLQSQMVEYAKYRGIYIMADRLNIISYLGQAQENAEKNKKAADVMEKKMDVDEKNTAADESVADLVKKIKELNAQVGEYKKARDEYLEALPEYMEKVKLENTDNEGEYDHGAISKYNQFVTTAVPEWQNVVSAANAVLDQAKSTKESLQNAVEKLENFKTDNKDESNETITSLMGDADENITYYNETCMQYVDEILEDSVLEQISQDSDLGFRMAEVMSQIEKAVEKYAEELAEQESDDDDDDDEEEDPILEYYYYYLNLSGSDESASQVIEGGSSPNRYYRPAVMEVTKYFEDKQWNEQNPADSKPKYEDAEGNISEDFAKKESNNEDEANKEDESTTEESGPKRGKIDKMSELPSQQANKDGLLKGLKRGFWNTDKTADLSGTKSAMEGGSKSIFLQIESAAESARDEVLSMSYMFGTFKTRMTGWSKFSKDGMKQSEKDNKYMPAWRYAHDGGEIDMRFNPKKDRDTVLRGEIEYLIGGMDSDVLNETAIYATISAERLANNVIAMYMEKKVVNPTCKAAAILASAATEFVVPEQVFFWLFITAWATAETAIEMHYLVDCGYKIPLLKTNKNILLTVDPDATGEGLIGNYGDPNDIKNGLFVTYEDYLLVMLLAQGSNKRIMRSADLIQIDMQKNKDQSGFKMSEAYVGIKADAQMSIRYLFGSTAPFKEDYEKNGVTGRMKFTNTIYQGY